MTLIITHPGQAHRDEVLACAILLATDASIDTIQRREPTPSELIDLSVYVVDVGRQHNPDRHNFDHHQDRNLPAAFRLVAQHLNLDGLAEDTYAWWEYASKMDTGLFDAFKSVGLTAETGFKTVDPLGGFIVRQFEEDPMSVIGLLRKFGQDLITYLDKIQDRLNWLRRNATVRRMNEKFYWVSWDIREEPTLASQQYLKDLALCGIKGVGMIISPDDRGDGWSLYRVADNPYVDFRWIKDDPNVTFAHPNGFIAKTKAMTQKEAEELAMRAVCFI